jgi:hypothetical protein
MANRRVLLLLACAWLAQLPAVAATPAATPVQSLYLQRCGGCHGLQGISAPRQVPTLRGQAGYFLCTPRGRAYIVRLPSLATAPIDDAQLAALANFVVFDLGAGDGERYPRYTAAEVGVLRRQPLTDTALAQYRTVTVAGMIARCAAPQSLRAYAPPGALAGTPSED